MISFLLLGMGMMSDGLKLAAGPALERALARSTKTRLRAASPHLLTITTGKADVAPRNTKTIGRGGRPG